jgi:hypothetical protein
VVVQCGASEDLPRLESSAVNVGVIVGQVEITIIDYTIDHDEVMRFITGVDAWEPKRQFFITPITRHGYEQRRK